MRFVMENTGPQDTVMEGWPVYGVFRAHAFFYFFPIQNVRSLMYKDKIREFAEELRSGAVRPKLIGFDTNIKRLPPEITSFIEAHYKPTRVGDFWSEK